MNRRAIYSSFYYFLFPIGLGIFLAFFGVTFRKENSFFFNAITFFELLIKGIGAKNPREIATYTVVLMCLFLVIVFIRLIFHLLNRSRS